MSRELNKNADNSTNVLGVGVSGTSMSSVLVKIAEKIKSGTKPYFIITAYSESLLAAEKNPDFKSALSKADLIVPDGVSVLAAQDYLSHRSGMMLSDLVFGFQIGIKVLSGSYQPVRGVDIFKAELLSTHRLYLSGGFNVAEKLAKDYPSVVGWDNGDKDVDKINAAKPDILFLALGRFNQEVWINQNIDKLKVKVVVGVGSAFDEVAERWQVPEWIDKMGLKWLWRVTRDPQHLFRALNAFPLFPLKVWLSQSHRS